MNEVNAEEAKMSKQDAQILASSQGNESPSSIMAKDFNADGSVAQMAGLVDGSSNSRPTAHNGQSQIAYDAEEE